MRTDGGFFYVQLEENGPIALLVSDPTPYLDKTFLKVNRKPGQSVAFIDTNIEFAKGEEGFGPQNGYFNPDMSTVKVFSSDDQAIKYFSGPLMAKLASGPVAPATKANNIDHLYNLMQDLAADAKDYSSDTSILSAAVGKNTVVQIGEAADPMGQMGIHLVHTPNVYIINKHLAPQLWKKLAPKALEANPKATYLICADNSDSGLFYSEKLKPVKESIKLFVTTDSKAAFDHLKKLCS